MSELPSTVHLMVKFDPEGFNAMLDEIYAEKALEAFEAMDPDYEYLEPAVAPTDRAIPR